MVLHRTAIPLRSIAAGELKRWAQNVRGCTLRDSPQRISITAPSLWLYDLVNFKSEEKVFQ
jgi:hypothetical protein